MKSHEKPFLFLSFVAPFPQFWHKRVGQVIGKPTFRFPEHRHKVGRDACFFFKLAQGGHISLFAFVDAALGHLPSVRAAIESLCCEDLASGVDQHDADARAIGQGVDLIGCHGHS